LLFSRAVATAALLYDEAVQPEVPRRRSEQLRVADDPEGEMLG
jgi:hypothetical protein